MLGEKGQTEEEKDNESVSESLKLSEAIFIYYLEVGNHLLKNLYNPPVPPVLIHPLLSITQPQSLQLQTNTNRYRTFPSFSKLQTSAKMFFSAAAAAAALFTLGANARITGFGCPETVVPGKPFKAVIITDKYEEIVTDVSISFGYGDRNYKGHGDYNRYNDYSPHNLGGYLDSYYLNGELTPPPPVPGLPCLLEWF